MPAGINLERLLVVLSRSYEHRVEFPRQFVIVRDRSQLVITERMPRVTERIPRVYAA